MLEQPLRRRVRALRIPRYRRAAAIRQGTGSTIVIAGSLPVIDGLEGRLNRSPFSCMLPLRTKKGNVALFLPGDSGRDSFEVTRSV